MQSKKGEGRFVFQRSSHDGIVRWLLQ